ncbi:hypothetical protein E2C01_021362 [Portunus trituberculatus]|uniref:Uncharacterized protein n=1 Tax=Portunus trituberculatus TaxID=210409 RepID=A0A5B7E4R4_PORTR|nr:hypothetical protein [Portunus trituberculatus]
MFAGGEAKLRPPAPARHYQRRPQQKIMCAATRSTPPTPHRLPPACSPTFTPSSALPPSSAPRLFAPSPRIVKEERFNCVLRDEAHYCDEPRQEPMQHITLRI